MTSELSNALNPNIVQTRSRTRNVYPISAGLAPQQQQQALPAYVPHRSELELAIAEQPRYRPPPPSAQVQAPNNTLDEILRVLTASKEEAEIERRRRVAWEQEQEAKFAHQQSEMEEQMTHMREELTLLKSYMNSHTNPQPPLQNSNPHTPAPSLGSHVPTIQEPPAASTPLTPVSQHAYPSQPLFVEGSSNHPYGLESPPTPNSSAFLTPQLSQIHSAVHSSTATPSPVFMAAVPSPSVTDSVPESSSNPRKRTSPPISSGQSEDNDSGTDGSESGSGLPRKRLNGHDKRCLTIQHAMRAHFLRVMSLRTDKELPESHVEGEPLPENQPVRFVWEKTSKQSPHNAAMKKRLLADIKAKQRRLYKHVPEKDFNNKTLDNAYDQCYTTFRQKFKTQRDAFLAMNTKRREEHKAMKSRRNIRKKAKLSSRAEARNRMDAFSHPTFDGAFQSECMSSEESCDEYMEPSHPSGAHATVQVLRMRGLPWRSTRLLRFYAHLDEDEKVDRSLKAKRALGRNKERCQGPAKDGFYLPPKGVASWMVSQRWIRETRDAHPDLVELLKGLVQDAPGFDWEHFDMLGMESEDEMEGHGHEEIPRSEISYSLAHALAPI